MNVKMEKLEKNVVKFEITVGADKFAEAVKKSYAKCEENSMCLDLEKVRLQ